MSHDLENTWEAINTLVSATAWLERDVSEFALFKMPDNATPIPWLHMYLEAPTRDHEAHGSSLELLAAADRLGVREKRRNTQ